MCSKEMNDSIRYISVPFRLYENKGYDNENFQGISFLIT